MANKKLILFRLVFPLVLLIACLVRVNFPSFLYVTFLLISPLLPGPQAPGLPKSSKRFVQVLVFIVFSWSCGLIVFHTVLLLDPPYGQGLSNCTHYELTARQLGFQRLDFGDGWQVARLLCPEVLLCCSVVYCYLKWRKEDFHLPLSALLAGTLHSSRIAAAAAAGGLDEESRGISNTEQLKQMAMAKMAVLAAHRQILLDLLTIFLLCVCGIAYPCFFNLPYFVLFWLVSSLWAIRKTMESKHLNQLKIGLNIYSGIHILLLYMYQFPGFQAALEPQNINARFFGFTALVEASCEQPQYMNIYAGSKWNHFFNVFLLGIFYAILSYQTRLNFIAPRVKQLKPQCNSPYAGLMNLFNNMEPEFVSESSERVSREVVVSATINNHNSMIPVKFRSMSLIPGRTLTHALSISTSKSAQAAGGIDRGSPLGIPLRPLSQIANNTSSQSGPRSTDNDHRMIASIPDRKTTETPAVLRSQSFHRVPQSRSIFGNFHHENRSSSNWAFKSTQFSVTSMANFLPYVSKYSYAVSLSAMMTWSIISHSWSTLIMLAFSCTAWLVHDSRQFCLRLSPFLVVYAQVLVSAQYIYSFELTNSELPEPGALRQIGLHRPNFEPFVALFLKTLFTLSFALTLREYLIENAEGGLKKLTRKLAGTDAEKTTLSTFGTWVSSVLAKYWIFISAAILLFISLRPPVTAYRLIYMSFFLAFVVVFQISLRHWLRALYVYYMVMLVYCMFVLTFLYTYQFHGFPELWRNGTGLTTDELESIGLKKFTRGELFLKLCSPISFLIITIIQVNFFHERLVRYMSGIQDLNPIDAWRLVNYSCGLVMSIHRVDVGTTTDTLVDGAFVIPNHDIADVILTTISEHSQQSEQGCEITKDSCLPTSCQDETPSAATDPGENELGKDVEEPKNDESDILLTSEQVYVSSESKKPEVQSPDSGLGPKSLLRSPPSAAKAKEAIGIYKEKLKEYWLRLAEHRRKAIKIGWRLTEIHLGKFIALIMVIISINEVSLLNSPYMIIIALWLPLEQFRVHLSHIAGVWSCIIILSKMLFQMKFVGTSSMTVNCTNRIEMGVESLVNSSSWIGLHKSESFYHYIQPYLALILLLTFQSLVLLRQAYGLKILKKSCTQRGILFPEVTRKEADEGVKSCILFFSNHFFYKFGLEVCFICTVITVGIRNDLVAVLYCAALIVLLSLKRPQIANFWSVYVAFLAAALPVQYFLCLGIPPTWCAAYPWTSANSDLIEWLFLPDYAHAPFSMKLAMDFFQFLFACCQLFVFNIELAEQSDLYPGGNNKEENAMDSSLEKEGSSTKPHLLSAFGAAAGTPLSIPTTPSSSYSGENPVPDFISYTKSYLDLFKLGIFLYMYWGTLAIIFVAGTSRVTLFAMGYVVASFLFLWNGSELFLRSMPLAIKLWNILIGYNVVVIFVKTCLQVVGCVFLTQLFQKYCWLIQLFGIACLKTGRAEAVSNDILNECRVPTKEAGILFDGVCFFFLLLQRRIFGSHYYRHVIAEFRAQHVFASRGAELLQELTERELEEQQLREQEIVNKIKRKMEKIRQSQGRVESLSAQASKSDLPRSVSFNKAVDAKEDDHDDDYAQDDHEHEHEHEHEYGQFLAEEEAMLGTSPTESNPPAHYSEQVAISLTEPKSQTRRQAILCDVVIEIPYDDYMQRLADERPPGLDGAINSDTSSMASPRDETYGTASGDRHVSISPVSLERLPYATSAELAEGSEEPSAKYLIYHPKVKPHMLHEKSLTRYQFSPSTLSEKDRIQRRSSIQVTAPVVAPSIPRSLTTPLAKQSGDNDPSTSMASGKSDRHSGGYTFAGLVRKSMHASGKTGPVGMGLASDSSDDSHLNMIESPPEILPETDEDRRKGLGPLQLLNAALRKGAIKQAVKDAKHAQQKQIRMEQHMSELFGRADRKTIRKRLQAEQDMRQMADFEEDNFNEVVGEGIGTNVTDLDRRKGPTRQDSVMDDTDSVFSTGERRRASANISDTGSSVNYPAVTRPPGYGPSSWSIPDEIQEDEESQEDHNEDKPLIQNVIERLEQFWLFLTLFFGGVLESAITWLLKCSRNYRYVAQVLQQEKRIQKKLQHAEDKVKYLLTMGRDDNAATEELEQLRHQLEEARSPSGLESEADWGREKHALVRFFRALYYLLISRSELFCYFMMVLNHMASASLISMALPLMAFLWGTLSVPKPSRLFWISVITYTEAVVVIKYLFQFGFFPWNNGIPNDDPFWPARIIGIEKKAKYAAWDLVLLMTLFFHRDILKNLGLWKDSKSDEQKKSLEEEAMELSRRSIKFALMGKHATQRTSGEVSAVESKKVSPDTVQNDEHEDREIELTLDRLEEEISRFKRRTEMLQKGITSYILRVIRFFGQLLQCHNNLSVDVYAPMFLCDFICFFIVVFGYAAFGTDQGAGGVAGVFSDNKVPGPFLAMLLVQFTLIIIDRALFLRKFLFGKLIYQLGLVIFIHIWMFLILPGVTDRQFTMNTPAKLWYFSKCIYFCISAWQIRCGYPTRILGNFLTKKYNLINMVLFKGFMSVPFLFELRALMDWIWTDTAMSLFDWLKLEDIYANIYEIKCQRKFEEDYPTPRGTKKGWVMKYVAGGSALVVIIFIIWFPLLLFSLANRVGITNLPIMASASLRISGYEAFYDQTAENDYIRQMTRGEFSDIEYRYRNDKLALSYLSDYEGGDGIQAQFRLNSSHLWQISPPARSQLIHDLRSVTSNLQLTFEWRFRRKEGDSMNPEIIKAETVIDLNERVPLRNSIADVISGSKKPIIIHRLYPPFIKLPAKADAAAAFPLLWKSVEEMKSSDISSAFINASLVLHSTRMKSDENVVEWWQLSTSTNTNITIRGFADKVFPSTISFIASGGIMQVYAGAVFLMSRVIRVLFTGHMSKIMFDELPNVDRILQLCIDIFLVRESRELELEEDLYAKLIFLYRSPATLIKWTKAH